MLITVVSLQNVKIKVLKYYSILAQMFVRQRYVSAQKSH